MTGNVWINVFGILACAGIFGWFLWYLLRMVGPRQGIVLILLFVGGPFLLSYIVAPPDHETESLGAPPRVFKSTGQEKVATDTADWHGQYYKQFSTLMDEGTTQLAKNPHCGTVRWRDISQGESAEQEPVFFYTCDAGHGPFNILVKKSEIDSARNKGAIDIKKTIPEAKGYALCEQYIKSNQAYGTSKDIHMEKNGNARVYANGLMHIEEDFSIKDKEEKRFSADCFIQPDGSVTGHISN